MRVRLTLLVELGLGLGFGGSSQAQDTVTYRQGPGTEDSASCPTAWPPDRAAHSELAMLGGQPQMRVSESMRRALAAYAPSFTPPQLADYAPDVAALAGSPCHLPLFGTVGDFNGDGQVDAALIGYDAGTELFVVLLSVGSRYSVIELGRSPKHSGALGRPLVTYLTYIGPGAVELPDQMREPGAPAPILHHDGFVSNYDAQASTLYHWNGRQFVGVLIGD